MNPFLTFNDAATPWQLGFQDSATLFMEGITDLHHILLYYIVIVVVFVSILLGCLLSNTYLKGSVLGSFNSDLNRPVELEIIWTSIPALILFFIAIPSFKILYANDPIIEPVLTIKAIGHQWYWHYEYCKI